MGQWWVPAPARHLPQGPNRTGCHDEALPAGLLSKTGQPMLAYVAGHCRVRDGEDRSDYALYLPSVK